MSHLTRERLTSIEHRLGWGSSDKWPVDGSIVLWACAAEKVLDERDAESWLLRSLAQYVSDLNIACEREPVSCNQSGICITEWCEPCAAKAWLENQRVAELEDAPANEDTESKPVLTACVDCGENTPESGLVCDECREDAQGD